MSSAYLCKKCELHATCKTVCMAPFTPTDPKFAIIGEAPTEEDDHYGEPWIPDLLEKELESHGLDLGLAFVSNLVKCRPPDDRDPKKKEINACRMWLEAELAWLREAGCEFILVLGAKAYKEFGGTGKITQAQGVSYPYEGFNVMPCIQPSAAHRTERNMLSFKETIARFARLVRGEEEASPPDCKAVLVNG